MAVKLFQSIEYDYLKFGPPTMYHPLRAVAFDNQVRSYLSEHPRAAVVAIAEGLQTSFWRVDNGELTWYSIDLPPVIDLRDNLLPRNERIVPIAMSGFDPGWMDMVDATDGIFITVEGLFMYLEPEEVLGLIAACAKRFPGGRMMFDNHPPWVSRRTMHGLRLSNRYITPPMPFALSAEECAALTSIDGVAVSRDVDIPPGRGIWSLFETGRSGHTRPSITLLEFE